MSDGNSMIPSDRAFDAYHAHRCVDCASVFGGGLEPAGDCPDGNLCQDCLEARREDEADGDDLLASLAAAQAELAKWRAVAEGLAEAGKGCYNTLEGAGWPDNAEILREAVEAYEAARKA